MKYLIVKNNVPLGSNGYEYRGKVVSFVKKIGNKLYHVSDPNSIFEFNIFKQHAKDVTSVYNKICHLEKEFDKLGPNYSVDWCSIRTIRYQFEIGKYPTKKEFNNMNKLHNSLK